MQYYATIVIEITLEELMTQFNRLALWLVLVSLLAGNLPSQESIVTVCQIMEIHETALQESLLLARQVARICLTSNSTLAPNLPP